MGYAYTTFGTNILAYLFFLPFAFWEVYLGLIAIGSIILILLKNDDNNTALRFIAKIMIILPVGHAIIWFIILITGFIGSVLKAFS